MLSYLLGKPTAYCSHEFTHVSFDAPLRALCAEFTDLAASLMSGDPDCAWDVDAASAAPAQATGASESHDGTRVP
eukprot:5690855-Lingulodinium_polyedra.AAC.1